MNDALPADVTEALRVLEGLAHGTAGAIPPDLLARHVVAVTQGADWAVTRAALEAILRRCAFARRDDLRVASRPSGQRAFGQYTTRRGRSHARPYATLLDGIDPLSGSCECPDFLRSSLGVCKHLLTILDALAVDKRRFARALAQSAANGRAHAGAPRLCWDPVRPLTGLGDPLARVSIVAAQETGVARPDPMPAWRRWFRPSGEPGVRRWVLREAFDAAPARREELVAALLDLVAPRGRRAVRLFGEPAAVVLLREESARLRRLSEARAAGPELRRAEHGLKRPLYPYQSEGVRRFLANGRLLLADDMGLGKTAQAIAACHISFVTRRVRRGLVIAPATLKEQWRREWMLFSDTPVQVVEGLAADRRRTYERQRHGFLIANYEQVLRDLDLIRAWNPDLVILDEAQRIKNWATKTAACVKELRPTQRLVLTGTPMENRLEELASILEWVDDQALEPKWRLAPLHTLPASGEGPGERAGARHLDTLRVRLAAPMLRRRRAEVLRQLPKRTDTVVPVEMTEEQADEHAAFDQPIAQLLRTARQRPLTQPEFLRLMTMLTMQRIVANGLAQMRFPDVWPSIAGLDPAPALLKSLATPKLSELREIVAQVAIEQGRKIVVFSQWRRMLTLAHWATAPLLRSAGLRATFFSGREGARQRTANLVAFHDDPGTRLLLATDAGGVGLNLQRAANCCINIDLPWNPAVLEQRIGRIYRLGQSRPIDVYNLVTAPSIEARIATLLSDKRALFSGLFDSETNEVRFERSGSFLERLERLIEPQRPTAPVARAEADDQRDDERPEELAPEDDAALTDEGPAAPPAAPPAPVDFDQMRRTLAALSVRTLPDGGLRIDAPPGAATSLAAMFEGLAELLRRAAVP